MGEQIEWACFGTDPKRDKHGSGMDGRPMHAVTVEALFESDTAPSACGRSPTYGWVGDLFKVTKCAHCLRALELHCRTCRGTGWSGRSVCERCGGTGERSQAGREDSP